MFTTHFDLSMAAGELPYSDCRFANFSVCLSFMVFLTEMDRALRYTVNFLGPNF